jgi:hypothetical protein
MKKERTVKRGQREKGLEQRESRRKDSFISMLRSEKGLALVTVLVLSLITLAIITTLIYMVIQGTRLSGYYKRFETAREAAVGGAEIGADLVMQRGSLSIPLLTITSTTYGAGGFLSCDCGDPDDPDDNRDSNNARTCLCDKLCDSTANWPGACNITMNPTDTPDLEFQLAGINANYLVSVKIVDTIRGNSDLSGEDLGGTGVVASSSAVIHAPPMPYLHRVEINSEATGGNLFERSRLSALYAY